MYQASVHLHSSDEGKEKAAPFLSRVLSSMFSVPTRRREKRLGLPRAGSLAAALNCISYEALEGKVVLSHSAAGHTKLPTRTKGSRIHCLSSQRIADLPLV